MFTDDINPLATITNLVAIKQITSLRFYELFLLLCLPFWKKISSWILDFVMEKYNSVCLFKKKQAIHNIVCKFTYQNNILWLKDIPHVYLCVMHDLYKHVAKNRNIKCTVNEVLLYNDTTMKMILFQNQKTAYKIRDKLLLKHMHDEREASCDRKDYVFHTYTLQLISTENNYDAIREYIEECALNYDDIQMNQLRQQQIFVFSHCNRDPTTPVYEEIPFNTTKSFDNMFFNQKQELISQLDFFTTKVDKYLLTGMPHTLGMLFYGAPGTGKTSAIKAIARHTKRHVVLIPLKKIKSIDVLRKIILSPMINGVKIPNINRLYVFEEIDCGQWKNIIKDRSLQSASSVDKQLTIDDVKNAIEQSVKANNKNKSDEGESDSSIVDDVSSSLDLGDFLELLDGIIEIPGRMIIMTTNNPKHLDPALTRPGRIDMIVEFTKLSKISVNEYFKVWFGHYIPNDIYDSMQDCKYTQAELGNLFSTSNMKFIYNEFLS